MTPEHSHIIPRLELCAEVLAVELADVVTEQLSMVPEDVKYTDSQVVLGYLYDEERIFFF